MRNKLGEHRSLVDVLTSERLQAAREAREKSSGLAAACWTIGDRRNYRQAMLDRSSARRVEVALQGGTAA